MVRLFVRHKVSDYAAWRKGYDAFEPARVKLGAQGHAVYRDVDDVNDVTVWHDFSNLEAYRALAVHARRIGMRGAICIHPAQVPILNDVFGGTREEVAAARQLLEVFDRSVAAGKGAVAHQGRMIDEPIANRARRFLQRHDALKAHRHAASQGTTQ